eukprot:XP_011669408.1 PREDICTED: uncharacterized protein LOC105440670 [Strongylocentrotus purpuratus]
MVLNFNGPVFFIFQHGYPGTGIHAESEKPSKFTATTPCPKTQDYTSTTSGSPSSTSTRSLLLHHHRLHHPADTRTSTTATRRTLKAAASLTATMHSRRQQTTMPPTSGTHIAPRRQHTQPMDSKLPDVRNPETPAQTDSQTDEQTSHVHSPMTQAHTVMYRIIQTFKVSHLNLRDDQSASSCLGKFLSLLPHLTDVEIRSSSLHDEFYKEIADRASSSQIHKFQGHDLNLRNNQSASSCMGKFLSLLPHLTDLEIRYCSLHGDFYKEIADRASSCQIQKFKLVYNCNLHAHQSESSCMGKFLSLLPHLIDLEISSCEFHDDFYKEIADRASSCQGRQKNGLPQGSVLAPLLFNVYTNDQPIHPNTRSFLYADDLCIATQNQSFVKLEESLSDALAGLIPYYATNHLRANPDKTQISAFHLKNRDANHQLRISWYGKRLKHTPNPVYLGVTLDRSLTYKNHIANTKAKVGARNSILKKLANTNWGTDARTIRTTALALCFSAAEYASPVWSRSAHAPKIDPALNSSCRAITGCLRPTKVEDIYLLCGIAPPHVRRLVLSQKEKDKQENNPLHPLFEQQPVGKRLKSRHSFLHSVEPLNTSPHNQRMTLWSNHLQTTPHKLSLSPKESLATGSSETWPTWLSLNRLRTGYGRCRVLMQRNSLTRTNPVTIKSKKQRTDNLEKKAQKLLEQVESAASQVGLQLNTTKTQFMTYNLHEGEICTADRTKLKQVQNFRYLGLARGLISQNKI